MILNHIRGDKVNELVKKHYEYIRFHCRPDKDKSEFEIFDEVFNMFFGQLPKGKSNFIGGINDKRNTLHENMFHMLYPDLTPQVHFGTGKGGLKKYHSKRFTADFYDEENEVIYEIDGSSHKEELQMLKDKIRDYFFWNELGIKTYRITNEEVEQMVIKRLEQLHEMGKLDV